MAGKSGALCALVLLCCACGESQPGQPAKVEPPGAVAGRQQVLASVASRVILPTYATFEQDLQALKAATAALQLAPSDAATLEGAQTAWRQAMGTWQRAEVFQVGPAGAMDLTPGGEDLRDAIYSWPLVSACVVDQTLTRQEYGDLDKKTITAKGLDALEYLLFHTTPENSCAPNSAINASGDWEKLGAQELASRRAAYGDQIAADLQRSAAKLHALWRTDGGNFAQTFSRGTRRPTGRPRRRSMR